MNGNCIVTQEAYEKLPLLRRTEAAPDRTLRSNFSRLGLAIGLSHAAVATSLRMGTVVLGNGLGSTAAAMDRGMHGMGALFLAPAALLQFGAKNTLTLSMALFCLQVGLQWLRGSLPPLTTPFFCLVFRPRRLYFLQIVCHTAGFLHLQSDDSSQSWFGGSSDQSDNGGSGGSSSSSGAGGSSSDTTYLWVVVVAGAFFEGLGAAWLWTAQVLWSEHLAEGTSIIRSCFPLHWFILIIARF